MANTSKANRSADCGLLHRLVRALRVALAQRVLDGCSSERTLLKDDVCIRGLLNSFIELDVDAMLSTTFHSIEGEWREVERVIRIAPL
jgi:hypothetical protein